MAVAALIALNLCFLGGRKFDSVIEPFASILKHGLPCLVV